MKSWKTTAIGLLIAAITGIGASYPEYAKICALICSILTGVGFMFARDNKKTSESVGAK